MSGPTKWKKGRAKGPKRKIRKREFSSRQTSEVEIGWRKNYTTARESKSLKHGGTEETEVNRNSGLINSHDSLRLHKNPTLTTDNTDLHGSKSFNWNHFKFVNPRHPCSSVVRFAFCAKPFVACPVAFSCRRRQQEAGYLSLLPSSCASGRHRSSSVISHQHAVEFFFLFGALIVTPGFCVLLLLFFVRRGASCLLLSG